MNRTSSKNISTWPFYLLLLPVFFAFHGFLENMELVFLPDVLNLTAWYLLVALGLFGISWLIFRDIDKAGLFSFILLSFNFFFGVIHDGLKQMDFAPFLGKYRFILPFFLLLLIFVFFLIKRTKKELSHYGKYLNILLILLILMDIVQFPGAYNRVKNLQVPPSTSFTPCENCTKPDIYLIIADAYPSNIALKERLNFDNEAFLTALKKRGFYIADSSNGNYNMTPISIASLLDMNYVRDIGGNSKTSKRDVAKSLQLIRDASAPAFLRSMGYKIYNHSIFDLGMEPSVTEPSFLPKRTSFITAQTFVKRVLTDLGFHLIDKFNIKFVIRFSRNVDLRNNNKIIRMTTESAAESEHPKFVYAHLLMPHHPYYFDSSGNQRPVQALTPEFIKDTSAFVSYLQYANGVYLSLIDTILKRSKTPPLIIFSGDHGFRNYKDRGEKRYHFMNLSAVYRPDGNYSSYYPGISNVNQFRVLFNDQFRQGLPLLKDSTSFLLD